MGKVKKLFDINFIHLEIRRGTQQQARDYCQKHDTRVDGPWEYGTPHKAGKRNDIEEMYDDIEEGFTLKKFYTNTDIKPLTSCIVSKKPLKF